MDDQPTVLSRGSRGAGTYLGTGIGKVGGREDPPRLVGLDAGQHLRFVGPSLLCAGHLERNNASLS